MIVAPCSALILANRNPTDSPLVIAYSVSSVPFQGTPKAMTCSKREIRSGRAARKPRKTSPPVECTIATIFRPPVDSRLTSAASFSITAAWEMLRRQSHPMAAKSPLRFDVSYLNLPLRMSYSDCACLATPRMSRIGGPASRSPGTLIRR